MIRLEKIRKSYGAREVLRDLTWAIPPGARVGLVGRNGSGKTTLLRLIAGEEETDAGMVERPRDVAIGYLPQEGARAASGTVLEALLDLFPEIARLEHRMAEAHEAMARLTGDDLERVTREAGDLQHRFEAAGGFRIEAEAKRILTGLGFAASDHARPLAEMSGGFRMRAALGALLLRSPDYLLLDEPTNHLDLDAVGWLETFLAESRSALVVVSHDRAFLNRTISSIADLDAGAVKTWTGDYDRYRKEKDAHRERMRAQAAQETHRRSEVERFIERFRYKATKARQVQSRIKMLEKMKQTEVPPEERNWRFLLPPAPRGPALAIAMTGVVKAFDGRGVLGTSGKGIDLELRRGDRVALVGPNGSGKSTLLRIAAGHLSPDAGHLEVGEKVVRHYFAQHVLDSLMSGRTVIDEMRAWAPDRSPGELRSLLGVFQFSGEDVFKPVDVLSGGEKNRLALARLMLDPGNFLLLDEPTNHLDLPAREALEDALSRFDGSLLFVSHDRYFINKVATRVAGLSGGRLLVLDGGWDAYRAWLAAGEAAPETRDEAGEGRRTKERKRADARERNERSRRERELRRAVENLEAAVTRAEHRVDEIDARLADPATWDDPPAARALGEERKRLQEELSRLDRKWEAAMRDLESAG